MSRSTSRTAWIRSSAESLVNERLPRSEAVHSAAGWCAGDGSDHDGAWERFISSKSRERDTAQWNCARILDWDIAPKLRGVEGVVEVNTQGGDLKTYEIAGRQRQADRLSHPAAARASKRFRRTMQMPEEHTSSVPNSNHLSEEKG